MQKAQFQHTAGFVSLDEPKTIQACAADYFACLSIRAFSAVGALSLTFTSEDAVIGIKLGPCAAKYHTLPCPPELSLQARHPLLGSVGRNEVDSEVARVRSDERVKAQQRLRAAHSEAEDLRRKLDTMLEKCALFHQPNPGIWLPLILEIAHEEHLTLS